MGKGIIQHNPNSYPYNPLPQNYKPSFKNILLPTGTHRWPIFKRKSNHTCELVFYIFFSNNTKMSTYVIFTDLITLTTLKDVTPLIITLFLMLAIHMIKNNMSYKILENLPVTKTLHPSLGSAALEIL